MAAEKMVCLIQASMMQADDPCDRIAIIYRGRILACGGTAIALRLHG